MTRRIRVLACVALVSVAAACSSPTLQQPTGPPSAIESTSPATVAVPPARPSALDLASVDATNPDAVAEAVARTSLLWDTATDANEYDARYRAAALMTPELAASFAPTGQGRNADPAWSAAAAVQAYTVPEIYSGEDTHGAPPDSPEMSYRVYEASWVWVGNNGSVNDDPRTRYLYLSLAKQPDGRWLVSTYDVTDV